MKTYPTGMNGPKGKSAQEAFQDAAPRGAGKGGDNFPPAGAGDGGVGPKMASGGNRTSDIRKATK